jgi:hypothetical protein
MATIRVLEGEVVVSDCKVGEFLIFLLITKKEPSKNPHCSNKSQVNYKSSQAGILIACVGKIIRGENTSILHFLLLIMC